MIPVAAWSKAWACGRSLAGFVSSNLAETWIFVTCECCVFSGRGLCDGLITRPEEFYRVWRVWVWSWSLDNEEALDHWGAVASWQKNLFCTCSVMGSVLYDASWKGWDLIPICNNKCSLKVFRNERSDDGLYQAETSGLKELVRTALYDSVLQSMQLSSVWCCGFVDAATIFGAQISEHSLI